MVSLHSEPVRPLHQILLVHRSEGKFRGTNKNQRVVETQAGTKLQVINGGEFLSLAFIFWLKLHGVPQHTTPPRFAESNGLAKRLNRTLQDKCRTMMVAAKVPCYLWAEFYDAANTLRNLTPIDKSQRGGKFEPVAYKGVLVNYHISSTSYEVWDPVNHKVYNVGEPAFDEAASLGWWRQPASSSSSRQDDDNDMAVIFPDIPLDAAETEADSTITSDLDNDSSLDISSEAKAAAPPATSKAELQATTPTPTTSTPASATPSTAPATNPCAAATTTLPETTSTEQTVSNPRRSERSNRGVPPLRLAEMLVAAMEGNNTRRSKDLQACDEVT